MFEAPFVSLEPVQNHLDLRGVPILVDSRDYDGIRIAVKDLARDLASVTGQQPAVWENAGQSTVDAVILVGSVEESQFIHQLMEAGALDLVSIDGKWEVFQTALLDCPWPFAKRMLVIAGSDKRGTIFGVYTLSEQIGVSPWYWWADVPIPRHEHIYALPVTTSHGPPSVQYRGLFINDECPALTDWVHEKFGPKYNSKFYKRVFELILRLKANYLWPAMWSGFPEQGSIFFLDDPLNQQLADTYGIVVSTSHHEPMQRNMSEWRLAKKGKWVWEENKSAITEFFRQGAERARPFESVLTLGMRGESDGEMQADDPKAVLQDVIATQRALIQDVYGKPDGVPQVMALYKEVQEYFEAGLSIPEDVTILFSDDNFGNIRRLPTKTERDRHGGVGIYYHLEYVGWPRSYKWLNSNSCAKIQQQLGAAHASGANKLWIFNVGDIKPQELPLTFALSMAWDVNHFTPLTLPRFFRTYAGREFGSRYTQNVSELLQGHDRLVALRRHEHIDVDTFSLLHYREAESIVVRWQELECCAIALMKALPASHKGAFFQLVLHPIKASRINTELRVTQARNQLYGLQRRNTTNVLFRRALQLFEDDFSLSEEFHHSPWFADKWNHIVKQPHYGFSSTTWHAPSRDCITGLSFVQRRQDSNRITGQMGVAVEGSKGIRPGLVNEESDRMQPSRGDLMAGLRLPSLSVYGPPSCFFEVYTRGTSSVDWVAHADRDWVRLSLIEGHLSADDEDHRIEVSVDWDRVPTDFYDMIVIDIRSQQGDYEQVHVEVINRRAPKDFYGFVESSGYVAIDAGLMPLSKTQSPFYQTFPYLGRSMSGAIALACSGTVDVPCLEYPVYLFSSPLVVVVSLYFTVTLDYQPEEPMRYEISFDDAPQTSFRLLRSVADGKLPVGWSTAVQDGVWTRKHPFGEVASGSHVLKYRPLTTGLLLEKIVIDVGGVQESYLGPPPSCLVGEGR